MLLNELLDTEKLAEHIKRREITERRHPEFPKLAIYNYGDVCQYENIWTHETKTCRGLIVNTQTGSVLSRPFAKFYNWGDERNVGDIDLDAPIVGAFDKLDGSLGVGYVAPDGSARIATRGSFDSEQARHANARIAWEFDAYIKSFTSRGNTPLFEIVYPENRIVVDYGDRDELVYLGNVSIEDGSFAPNLSLKLPADCMRDVLALPNRTNAEGAVIWLNPTTALKLKQEDYKALHKIVTGLNRKSVWRSLMDGTYDEMVKALPDEFYKWADGVAEELQGEFDGVGYTAAGWLEGLREHGLVERKDQALWITTAVPSHYRGLIFSMLDGKDISPAIWRMIEPAGGER